MQITYNQIPIKLKWGEVTCMQKIDGEYKFQRLEKDVTLKHLLIAESIDKKYTKEGKDVNHCFIIGKLTRWNISINHSILIAKIYRRHIQWR